MPYADPAKNNACKRAWELRQKALRSHYWVAKRRRVSKRKKKKWRDSLSDSYIKQLLHWPDAPQEVIALKRAQLIVKRTKP